MAHNGVTRRLNDEDLQPHMKTVVDESYNSKNKPSFNQMIEDGTIETCAACGSIYECDCEKEAWADLENDFAWEMNDENFK